MSNKHDFKTRFGILQAQAEEDWAAAMLDADPHNDPCATYRRRKPAADRELMEPDDDEQSKQMAAVVEGAVKGAIAAKSTPDHHDVEVPTPWGTFRGGLWALVLLVASALALGWFWLHAQK